MRPLTGAGVSSSTFFVLFYVKILIFLTGYSHTPGI
jgi:hypothetical protein